MDAMENGWRTKMENESEIDAYVSYFDTRSLKKYYAIMGHVISISGKLCFGSLRLLMRSFPVKLGRMMGTDILLRK